MTLIADNIIILDQHNNFMCEKLYFKTSAELFSVSKDKQYIFKINIINNIDSTAADSVMQFIEMSVNASSDNNSIMIIFNSVIYKLLEFK